MCECGVGCGVKGDRVWGVDGSMCVWGGVGFGLGLGCGVGCVGVPIALFEEQFICFSLRRTIKNSHRPSPPRHSSQVATESLIVTDE